jgi:hypothetical protein
MRRLAPAGSLFIAIMLAGCAGGPSLLDGAPPAQPAEALTMPGRWMLSAPNAPDCGMNFSAAPGKNEGSVVPEGGCPGKFFTSRRWTLDKDALTIIDDGNEALATLTLANGQFDGKSVNDMPVTLKR